MWPSIPAGGSGASCRRCCWCRSLLGFLASSMGLLVSGGSMATLTGLAVARHVQLTATLGVDVQTAGLHGVGRRLRVYTSTEGHSCSCRKPRPRMVLDLARHYGIDLARARLVGDTESDARCAHAAGAGTFVWEDAFFGRDKVAVGDAAVVLSGHSRAQAPQPKLPTSQGLHYATNESKKNWGTGACQVE
jgi:hypothetical protein